MEGASDLLQLRDWQNASIKSLSSADCTTVINALIILFTGQMAIWKRSKASQQERWDSVVL